MARVKLEVPLTIIFSTNITVRITDINYGNHLGNHSLVGLLHEARMRWLQSLELSELNIGGCGLIMADLAVEYKLEGLYNDALNISLSMGDVSAYGFDLFYYVVNQNNSLVAKAKTGMVCYDYALKKVVAIPGTFKMILQS
jgi:acyl-CoA thioester hydrolase